MGEVRKKALIRHFGSMRGLLAASAEDIALVPGVGRGLADRIYRSLHGLELDTAGLEGPGSIPDGELSERERDAS